MSRMAALDKGMGDLGMAVGPARSITALARKVSPARRGPAPAAITRRLPPVPRSRKAVWGRRLVAFAWPVLLLTGWAFRSRLIDALALVVNLGLGFLLAITGFALAVAALVEIWRRGSRGLGAAAGAILLGLPLLGLAAAAGAALTVYPPINSISTDPENAPAFRAAAAMRQAAGAAEPGDRARLAAQQRAAYPDIAPLQLETDAETAYTQALALVQEKGWVVLQTQPPTQRVKRGRIEATAFTAMLRFPDDVVIELADSGTATRVDMRSASRFGRHDLGQNPRRIRSFLAELKTRVEEETESE